MAYKPGSVHRTLSERRIGSHSSATPFTRCLMRHTRDANQRQLICIPYLVLLQAGFTVRALLPDPRWALTPPFHPYPSIRGGLLSVALSLGSHRADIIRRLVSMEPGLSSRHGLPHVQRLPGHLIESAFTPDLSVCPEIWCNLPVPHHDMILCL